MKPQLPIGQQALIAPLVYRDQPTLTQALEGITDAAEGPFRHAREKLPRSP
jgi:hypothetical protein